MATGDNYYQDYGCRHYDCYCYCDYDYYLRQLWRLLRLLQL